VGVVPEEWLLPAKEEMEVGADVTRWMEGVGVKRPTDEVLCGEEANEEEGEWLSEVVKGMGGEGGLAKTLGVGLGGGTERGSSLQSISASRDAP
jgi:hypothetical protein